MPLFSPSATGVQEISGWRAVNLPASATTAPIRFGTGGSPNWVVHTPGEIIGIAVDVNTVIPAGSTTALVQITVNGGAPVNIAGLPAGFLSGVIDSGPFPMTMGDLIIVQFTTDAGWTGIFSDPQVALRFRPS